MTQSDETFAPPPTWNMWKAAFGHQDRSITPFGGFEPYIHFDSLPSDVAKTLTTFLQELYSLSGNTWKPQQCRSTEGIASWAYDILKTDADGRFSCIKKLSIKRFSRDHFWIELEVENCNEPIIIDPTGVPVDGNQREQNIIPFFGPIRFAQGFAKQVYEREEDYDGTTRDFPPGFHP